MVTIAMAPLDRGRLHPRQRILGVRTRTDEIDGNGRAFLRQPNRDRAADALRGTGDERVSPDQTRWKLR